MRNVLPRLLIISTVLAALAVFPTNSFASQLSLIFPIPTITIPPMPNSLPSRSGTTITETTNVQITTNGTTEVITGPVSPTTSPTVPETTNQVSAIATPTLTLSQRIFLRLTPSPTVKISVTATPRPTATVVTSTPTKQPTATSTPTTKPSNSPTPTSVNSTSDTVKNYIMSGINTYRHSLGLSSVQTSGETCAFAKIRAKEISTSFNHAGFESRIAAKTIPYSSWTLITENLAMTSDYRNVVNMWINSPGHAANMQKDTPYVCVENYGNYYAYEGMRP